MTTDAKPIAPAAPKDRGVLVHLIVLAVAAGSAFTLWTRDKEPKALVAGDVTVWSGRAADVKHIGYASKTKKVSLDVKQDDRGRYLVGTFEHEPPAPKATGDAGAPPPAAKPTTTPIVSVGEGEKLVEALAPLKALRDLGKVADDKLKDFGLDDPDGTLTVDVGGTKHELVVGGATPGSGDRYVKDAASGEVYALKGDLVRDVESADSHLAERDLHEFHDNDVQTATLEAGGKKRDVVRGGAEGKRFWADKAAPQTNDETLGNWMSKLERLRPLEYVDKPPEKKEPVLTLTFAAGKPLGFLELVKAPNEKGKNDYFVRTERTRLFAKVASSTAEQVEQDLAGVMK